MDEKLKVTFLAKENSKVLAVVDTCFNSLAIPTIVPMKPFRKRWMLLSNMEKLDSAEYNCQKQREK